MKNNQQEIEAILKKLTEHGYDGLDAHEKQLLFRKQFSDAHSTRYDTPFELGLTLVVTFFLAVHGLQRMVLATELPVYLKLGSFAQGNVFSKWFNMGLGAFCLLFFGLLFVLNIKDWSKGKVYFTHHGPGNKNILKYIGRLSFIIIIIVWIGIKIISCWPVFMEALS